MQVSASAPGSRRIVPIATTVSVEPGLIVADAPSLAERLLDEARALGGRVWLVAWLDAAVHLGTVDPVNGRSQPRLEPSYLQELRLFNQTGEWRLWRTVAGFAARRRQDRGGVGAEALEDDQSLWGTDMEPGVDGWTVVREDRGIAYVVPHRLRREDLPLRLRLRHYLTSDEAGMVAVQDSRLVALCSWSGEPLVWEEEGDGAGTA